MPKIFGPIEDEIDISGEEYNTPDAPQELPDEVNIEDTEGTPDAEPEETPAEEEPTTEDEPTADVPGGKPSEEQEPNSSLTSEPDAQPSDEPTPTPDELSDDRVLTYLSEKLGREVKSLDDLTPQETAAEDPFNGDEELKAISEWKERTNRPVSDYYKFQKDYDSMEPIDVVRENLQLQYPDFTPEEIQLEMEEFIADEDIDTDTDIARKNLRLKKEAVNARKNLNEYKSTYDTPIEPKLSKEQQEAINFYAQYQEQSAKAKDQTDAYTAGIQTEASTLESLPLNLEDDLSIDLKLTDEERKSIPDAVSKMSHWYNEDGSYNHNAIVKDYVKIANFDKAVKLAYEQGVNKGIEQEDKDSRNVDFSGARKGMPTSNEEIVVEGADRFNNTGLKFGRR